MEEKKSSFFLSILMIIILIIGLIGSGYFIYYQISYNKNTNDNKSTNEIEESENNNDISLSIDEINNMLKMVPTKTVNVNFVGYKVDELTDLDINNLLCSYIYNNSSHEQFDKGVMMEKSVSLDVISKFLGKDDYIFNENAGNTDIRYNLKEEKTDDKIYYKLTDSSLATDAFTVYEYIYLDNYSCNDDTKECIIKTKVKQQSGGWPTLYIGEADIYITKDDNNTLSKVEYTEYEESIKAD